MKKKSTVMLRAYKSTRTLANKALRDWQPSKTGYLNQNVQIADIVEAAMNDFGRKWGYLNPLEAMEGGKHE